MKTAVTDAAIQHKLNGALTSYDRTPFISELATWLEGAPTAARVKAFALKHPERWAQTVSVLARLAGFTDKTESLHTHVHAHIHQLSDVDLAEQLRGLNELLSMKTDTVSVQSIDALEGNARAISHAQPTDNGANDIAHPHTEHVAPPAVDHIAPSTDNPSKDQSLSTQNKRQSAVVARSSRKLKVAKKKRGVAGGRRV